jgi:transcriptional regulator with XRE-family HTH domain
MTKAKTSDAVEILRRRYVEGNPEAEALLEEVEQEAEIARRVYHLRTAAGLTQRQLAEKVGTTASVICRIEDADYEGRRSLPLLRRIAAALGHRARVVIEPVPGRSAAPQPSGTVAGSRRTSDRVQPVLPRPGKPQRTAGKKGKQVVTVRSKSSERTPAG